MIKHQGAADAALTKVVIKATGVPGIMRPGDQAKIHKRQQEGEDDSNIPKALDRLRK